MATKSIKEFYLEKTQVKGGFLIGTLLDCMS